MRSKVEEATLYEGKGGRCDALCGKRWKMRHFMRLKVEDATLYVVKGGRCAA